MKTTALILVMIFVFSFAGKAQDPHFSQWWSSPLNTSPARTLQADADVRIMGNMRQQWINPAAPYYTGSLSVETSVLSKKTGYNKLAWGIGFMHDNTFEGILKSNFISSALAYHQLLGEDLTHSVSVGLGITNTKRTLDFYRLYFATQFSSDGFDLNLPSGETALSNMKAYWSLSAGLAYGYTTVNTRIDLGVSAYQLNAPRQTFLSDPYQIVPTRYVGYLFFDKTLSNEQVLNVVFYFQQQARHNYSMIGFSCGFPLQKEDRFLNVGLLYRYKDAIIPNLSLLLGNKQIGLSYDATMSKLNTAAIAPQVFELSFSWRTIYPEKDKMKCPHSPFR
jgi:type IX secretion system PorP/SprF family membrane protein